MFFTDRSKEYPHLVRYLQEEERSKSSAASSRVGGSLMLGLGTFATVAGILGGIGIGGAPMIPLLVIAAVFFVGGASLLRKRPEPSDPLQTEARKVVHSLHQMIQHRRLHRDLDAASLAALEACAFQRFRARQALTGPNWREGGSYGRVREAALGAVDGAMYEALVQFRGFVPERVGQRPAGDWLDEAIEVFGGKGAPGLGPLAPFEPVVAIGEKLRELADEAHALAARAASDPTLPEAPVTSGLEQSLGELRALREAEDELRQNA